jgi:hypothetical protein
MHDSESHFREALARIADEARRAISGCPDDDHEHEPGTANYGMKRRLVCSPKSLPSRLLIKAAKTARNINPANAVVMPSGQASLGMTLTPLQIAVVTAKYWGPQPRQFTVSFMDSTPSDLRTRILSHMNAWNTWSGMSFVETGGTGDVRISRGTGGYWSYLGTDILHIPKNRQTMNLQDFTMNTPDSEYKRVIRHETGLTLGFPHEHMRQALVDRIDPDKAYDFFLRTYGWDKATVDQQVLTPLDEKSLMGTPEDQTSIMCYQLPASITKDGEPILGGTDINATDGQFAAKIYPRAGKATTSVSTNDSGDWDPSEDLDVS